MAYKLTPWELRRDSIGNLYVGVVMEGYFLPIATVAPSAFEGKQKDNGYLLASSPKLYDACVSADTMLSKVRVLSEALSEHIEGKRKKWEAEPSTPAEVMKLLTRMSQKLADLADEAKRIEQETTYAIEKANGMDDEIKPMSYTCPRV
jgi:hypothetical protein